MKILKFTWILFFCLFAKFSFAQFDSTYQDRSSSALREKMFFGGGLGLQFGTITVVNISPTIGYRIRPYWSVGTNITYEYCKDATYKPSYSTSTYGASVFSRVSFMENFLVHAEIESLNMTNLDYYPENKRIWVTSVLAGGGYRQRLGANSFVNLLVLWNLNQTRHSPYSNPLVRVGFEF